MVMSRRVVIIDWSGDMRVAIATPPGSLRSGRRGCGSGGSQAGMSAEITPGSHQPHSIFAPDASRMAVHFGISAFT